MYGDLKRYMNRLILSKNTSTVCGYMGTIVKTRGGGGGVDSSIKMPGCVCWVSENVPILKDPLGKKNIPILNGSSAYFIPILWCNIKLKCIIPKGHSQSIIF